MTRTAVRLAAALALLSTSQLQAAPPAPARPCLTPAELRAMVSYAIPSVLDSVIGRCRPVLPADASLLKHGVELVREFDSGRVAAFPLARRGFAKFSDKSAKNTAAIMLAMPEETLRPVVDEILRQKVTGSILPQNCADIDHVFATLEPLPASNSIDLVTQVLTLGARDDKQIEVCNS